MLGSLAECWCYLCFRLPAVCSKGPLLVKVKTKETPSWGTHLLLLHLYPTSMWGRYGTIVASMQLGRTPPLLTVPSLSDRLSHRTPTSSLVFLSCFLALLYPSPTFLRTHLLSSHSRTILRSWTFFEISPTFVLPLLIFSFMILSNLVTLHIHRNIFIHVTFFTANVCAP